MNLRSLCSLLYSNMFSIAKCLKTIRLILKPERALSNLNLNYEERIKELDSLKSLVKREIVL
jgi:hypothetical protein